MHGYSQHTNEVTLKNTKAFMRELEGSLDFVIDTEGANWDDVLEAVRHSLEFWCSYYCGVDPEDFTRR
jgi:hypothetical protein